MRRRRAAAGAPTPSGWGARGGGSPRPRGGGHEALAVAPLWEFGPVMGELISEPDPRAVQRRAAELSSPERTVRSWVVGRDPAVHARRIEELLAARAPQGHVRSGPTGQLRGVDVP